MASHYSTSKTRLDLNEQGAILVETAIICVVLLPCLFGLMWLGIIPNTGVQLECALREGVRASVPGKSTPAQYLAAIETNIIASAAARNLVVTNTDISICPVNDFAGSYAPPIPAICTTDATDGYGEPFYIIVNLKQIKFLGFTPLELNLTAEGFFLYQRVRL